MSRSVRVVGIGGRIARCPTGKANGNDSHIGRPTTLLTHFVHQGAVPANALVQTGLLSPSSPHPATPDAGAALPPFSDNPGCHQASFLPILVESPATDPKPFLADLTSRVEVCPSRRSASVPSMTPGSKTAASESPLGSAAFVRKSGASIAREC